MTTHTAEIRALAKEIGEKKKQLAAMRSENREAVKDYLLDTTEGAKPLSSFFGDKDELVVIHNMGRDCNYCSLWADGFTGFTKHIQTRAGFVLVSADSAAQVAETAEQRGWNFPVAGNGDSGFALDMGLEGEDGSPWPGISAFVREDGQIYRRGWAGLGPGDEFCSIWGMWDLFPNGEGDWEPK